MRNIFLLAFVLGLTGCVSTRPATSDPAYLFATFREPEQDGLRYAYSYDGYHWTNLPGTFLPAEVDGKIMRDPSLARGADGIYHCVWTSAWRGNTGFGCAQSHDLIHWTNQQFIPVMAHEPDVQNVWAPEIFCNDSSLDPRPSTRDHSEFIIAWASTIPGRFPDHLEPHTNNHRMYFTTTCDFATFTPAKLFLDPDFSVIDCQILRDGDRYVLLLKDNTRQQRNVHVAFADSPLGPWKNISPALTKNFTEGPCGLRVGKDWLIFYEAYQAHHYGALRTRDFKIFTDVTDQMTFPPGLKHGTAIQISRTELDALVRAAPR